MIPILILIGNNIYYIIKCYESLVQCIQNYWVVSNNIHIFPNLFVYFSGYYNLLFNTKYKLNQIYYQITPPSILNIGVFCVVLKAS